MRIAVVIQRFGAEIVGGAEHLAYNYVEQFVKNPDWHIEVFTTAAVNYQTWKNDFEAGSSRERPNLIIHRFRSKAKRSRFFFLANGLLSRPLKLLRGRNAIARWLEDLWFHLQGPECPELLLYLKQRAKDFDAAIFVTYLYYPTIYGLPLLKDKAVLIPAAHDERSFYFGRTKEVLRDAKALICLSEAEAKIIKRVHPDVHTPIVQTGMGIENNYQGQSTTGDYLLYLGRISRGKGLHQLLEWLDRYNERAKKPQKLILAGAKEFDLPNSPHISYVGRVSDEDKWQLIDNALAIVSPSEHESLSLIVLEALARKKPVLLNQHCEIFDFYVRTLPTVLGFVDQATFNAGLDEIKSWNHKDMEGEFLASQEWLNHTYSWNAIIKKLENCLKQVRNGI
jgi:glycosyltransferase involved in cell wall biosynthesis